MSERPEANPTQEEVQALHGKLRQLQEPKGYFFNTDDELTWPLLKELLVTKARYGYMACPCRMANGSRDLDKDIICPCAYREPDVKEYGACYCGLYVSKEWNDGAIPQVYIPERRPPGNIVF